MIQEKAQIEREIEILKRIDHANCVKLFNVFHSVNQVYLVMELMSGGELFDRIIEKVRTSALLRQNIFALLISPAKPS